MERRLSCNRRTGSNATNGNGTTRDSAKQLVPNYTLYHLPLKINIFLLRVQANGPSKIEDLTKPTPGNKKCSKKMLFLTVFGVLLGFMILLESYSVYSMMQAQVQNNKVVSSSLII
jgi:hypothetical protein